MNTIRDSRLLALSVRQPFAEMILRGIKRQEFRSSPTKIRGKILLYAPKTLHLDFAPWEVLDTPPGDVSRGAIVGEVSIVSCEWSQARKCWVWGLSNPKRRRPRSPRRHPQPVFFRPF